MSRLCVPLLGLLLIGCGGRSESPANTPPESAPPSVPVVGIQREVEPHSAEGAEPVSTPRTAPDSPGETSFAQLSVLELIDRLVEVSQEEIDLLSSVWGSGFIAEDVRAKDDSNQIVVPPAMRELVRRGTVALPELINHISDARKTKLSYAAMTAAENYDPRHLRYRPRRAASIWDSSTSVPSFDVCVGDLCYVAIGQIVNRQLEIMHSHGKLGAIADSPIVFPAEADSVRRDWAGLTPEKHRESLVADTLNTTPYADWGAWRRLQFYFEPHVAEDVAVKLLQRPLYDNGKLWNFLEDVLVKEPDERRWQPLVDDYVRDNGVGTGQVLPFWLYWIFFDTDRARTDEFLTDAGTAQRILARLYPQFDRRQAAFFDAANLGEQTAAVKAVANFPSQRIDAAVAALFEAATSFPFTEDAWRLKALVEVCVTRLANTPYEEVCRRYCARRLADAESEVPRNKHTLAFWRNLLKLEPLDNPLSDAERVAISFLKQRGAYVDTVCEEMWFTGEGETDDDLKAVSVLHRLTGLHIGGEKITDAGLVHLAPLTNLRSLGLCSAGLTDDGLARLAPLVNLKVLYLNGTTITGKGLQHLRGMTDLEELHLDQSRIDDDGLRHLPHFPRLKELSLEECAIGATGFEPLSRMTTLETLNLTRTRTSDAALRSLQGLTGLTSLRLVDCENLTDAGLAHLQKLTSLKRLTIYFCENLTDGGKADLQKALPDLEIE